MIEIDTEEKKPTSNEELLLLRDFEKYRFDDGYVEAMFLVWYKQGQPTATNLHRVIPPDPTSGYRPAVSTLFDWINSETWQTKARLLDEEVARRMQEEAITEKIEMLRRHTELGVKAQTLASDWLESNLDEMTATSAVRLLVEGIKIERSSRGLDKQLEAVRDLTDDQLLAQLKEVLSGNQVDFDSIDE